MAKPEAGMMVTPSVKLTRPLGEGGMGSVWLADHMALHTQVVVKFIAADLTKSPEALARFSREAAAASQVKSPHVVQTFDHGVSDLGLPYIVMEYLEGRDLETHLTSLGGAMSQRDVVDVITQLSRALEKAHSIGIVHRDIKPANIFLCDAGDGALFVKLLDFGIAKVNIPMIDSGTRTGTMIGSPFYMSPEQLVGSKDVDHRTDLWSVGVVAFEALTGRRAFDAETVGALALKIHNEPIPLPSQVNVELANLDEWFTRACGKKPEQRFNSAKEMADALTAAVTGEGRKTTSIAPPGSRSSQSQKISGDAKTLVDPRTDPRLRTDAGLGLQASGTPAPRSRNLFLLAGMVVVGAISALGVMKLTGPKGQATADPSATNSVQHAANSIANSAGIVANPSSSVSGAGVNPTASTGASPSASAPTTASGVASVKVTHGGSGSTHKSSQNASPQASSSASKKPDDIY